MVANSRALFGRVTRLLITPETGDQIQIEGFDMSFDIEKNLEPDPNKGKFTLYNLPEKVRAKLQLKDTAKIKFEAGYKTTAAVVFEGTLTHAISYISGADWVTDIESGEGSKAYRSSYVSKSYGKGTPYKTIIQDVVKTFDGYKVTPQITKLLASLGDAAPNGLVIDGPSAKVLNSMLRGFGMSFSIQRGQIQILQNGGASDLPAVKLGYDSGLVDIPQLGEKKDKATVTFKSLLQPELFPGRRVIIASPGLNGTFIVADTKHKGANFGQEFYSVCQAALP